MNQSDECPICLNTMQKGSALFTTSCGHQFHFECIKDSIQHNNLQCPLCRGGVQQLTNILAPPVVLQPQPPPLPQQVLQQPPQLQQQQPLQRVPPVFSAPSRNVPSWSRSSRTDASIPAEDAIDEKELAALMFQKNNQNANNNSAEELLTLASSLEVKEVAHSTAQSVLAMLSVKAPAPHDVSASQRVPLDLVAVVDRSGSMGGTKIELVKETLSYLLTQLTAVDRFSIVSFDDKVYPITGLMKMTSQNRDRVEEIVNQHPDLRANGGTDIELGLRVGLRVLQERKTQNPVCSVLLLTDGQDRSADSKIKSMLPKFLPSGCSVHCFGFGADHDAKVLTNVAEMANGTFTYIENVDTVGEAFATCLGGLLSVVAQMIEVKIEGAPQHKITKVHSHFPQTPLPNGNGTIIKVPDLFADERRDLLFSVLLPALPSPSDTLSPMATVAVTYISPQTKQSIGLPSVAFEIKRPATVSEQGVNPELDVQRNRILAADTIAEATQKATASDFKGARDLLQATMDIITKSVSHATPLCQGLLDDLKECMTRFQDRNEFANGGLAWANSAAMEHKQQRAVSKPSAKSKGPSSAPSISSYATSGQQYQQTNVQQFKVAKRSMPHK